MEKFTEYLEYSLEVLHHCLTPKGFEDAEVKMSELEEIVRRKRKKVENVKEARNIFEEMKVNFDSQSDPFDPKYLEMLESMRDSLLARED